MEIDGRVNLKLVVAILIIMIVIIMAIATWLISYPPHKTLEADKAAVAESKPPQAQPGDVINWQEAPGIKAQLILDEGSTGNQYWSAHAFLHLSDGSEVTGFDIERGYSSQAYQIYWKSRIGPRSTLGIFELINSEWMKTTRGNRVEVVEITRVETIHLE